MDYIKFEFFKYIGRRINPITIPVKIIKLEGHKQDSVLIDCPYTSIIDGLHLEIEGNAVPSEKQAIAFLEKRGFIKVNFNVFNILISDLKEIEKIAPPDWFATYKKKRNVK